MDTVTIELATKSNIPNADGVIYDDETFVHALDSYRRRGGSNYGQSFVMFGSTQPNTSIGSIAGIDPNRVHSTLVSIEGNYAVLQPINEELHELFTRSMELEPLVLAMDSVAVIKNSRVIYGTLQIMSFFIVSKSSVTRKVM